MRAVTELSDTNNSDIVESLSTFDLPKIREYQKRTKLGKLSHIPGGAGLPFIGHTYWFLTDSHAWINRQYAKNGPVFRAKTPILDMVMLLGPEANKLVFKNEGKVFSNFLAWDNTFENLFDNALMERDFAGHKKERKVLQQAFKRPAIESHIQIMSPALRAGIEQWPTGRTIKAMDHVKQLLLNVGAKVFLGLEMGPQADTINQAFVDIVAGCGDPIRRKEIWFSPYAKGIRASKTLCKYIMDTIPERRKVAGDDMFSQLCHMRDDEGRLIQDEKIRDHIIFVLFAAHDTTTSSLSAILYALASNLEWQEELREEMTSLNKEGVEFDDINALQKTGWTFKEALRMFPALSVIPRYALTDFEFNGHLIPANTIVTVSSVFTHYMPEYWTNPHTFDPYRFSPGRAEEKQHSFQFIPFGGGAHKCLGLHFADIQVKIFLFHLLKNYKVTKNRKMTKYNYNNIPLTFPTDGLPLRFDKIVTARK